MNRKLTAIALAGSAVGVIDGVAAVISSAFRGVSPDRVFQYYIEWNTWEFVVSERSGDDRARCFTALCGRFGAATAYVLAASMISILNRLPLIFGPIYAVFVYFFMGEVVSALSNTAKQPRTLSGTVIGILIHIFCVGLPIALISSRYAVQIDQDSQPVGAI